MKWISMKEKPPGAWVDVLFLTTTGQKFVGNLDGSGKNVYPARAREIVEVCMISHWARLSDEPEQAEFTVILPCKIGNPVKAKSGNWEGIVEEFTFNSNGLFLYVNSNGYRFYVRPDEVIY